MTKSFLKKIERNLKPGTLMQKEVQGDHAPNFLFFTKSDV